ncbi:MAG TPA: prepilin-type N-terminal cleavage/methylation domain-containing protein [Armatimonadota bacterium]|nr:prepilin-type N-terminal cleavage/methylation domain-containing protein [Armatimonadota bacterium]
MAGANSRKQGFTLIEILVVITIISILAAILLPVFSAVRARARSASCISNLRQIGAALSIYQQDYDGFYPFAINPAVRLHPDRWSDDPEFESIVPNLPEFHDVLYPYTRSRELFRCPSDFGMPVLEQCPGWGIPETSSVYETYGTSYFYLTEYAGYHLRDGSLQFPSRAAVVVDAGAAWHGAPDGPFPEESCIYARYNVLFADLHVRELSFYQLGDAFGQTGASPSGPR